MSRELCLRFYFNILVFILCQKRGNFLFIFLNIFSRFYKKTNQDLYKQSET